MSSDKKRILMVFGWPLLPVDRLDPRTSQNVCKHALELWRVGNYDFLLLSGGRFLPSDIQTRPWSHLARDYMVEQGVDPTKMLVEDASLDTYENIKLSLSVLADAGVTDYALTVCTHWIHGLRIQFTTSMVHGMHVRIEPVTLPLGAREWMMQWVYVLYHFVDRAGNGWYARRTRARRLASTKNL